jgi:hypothetical protein
MQCRPADSPGARLRQFAPEGADVEIFGGLAEIPFYNEDIDQYGGAWEQDETLKAAGIASGKVLEDADVSIPGSVTPSRRPTRPMTPRWPRS